ncbi:UDP-3-O-(3-hydroxymyristoyl)glucosamine N-acyltransferase [Gluconacetobacter azotocaptans]|uniref:UDP-3-O-acylglucosamine N-acyltransferase n=1 Tax=Gluconacetobacter azotocaptans TaxID=142834 RepID=A0A7W4JRR5_9PROT|nr:UDP-3-O-(3-hydroxymyristoyl)glucosamine N-acyltransferase [Gluconacetobacter azotocaptans]MBB2189707.1 UDP-3-O-(3-hydroxymyristoyl)glucosamine N-acyltransferase [Gluconacetobacter azotocaptans]GBQ29973.1 UDP-3-O-[3-hydroxymyristoyl] glucosamine N-acyltransferase [Gluconacetobacter azotocaptans DSM 13594]
MDRQVSALPGDRRFFERNGPFPIQVLAECAGARIEAGGADGGDAAPYVGIAPLQSAGPREVSFLDNRRYAPLLEQTKAGVVILSSAFVDKLPKGTIGLVSQTPYLAWARVASLFHPLPAVEPGIHPTAVIGAGTVIDPTAQIGPFVVLGANVQVGAGTRIDAHAVIGDGVMIGVRCRLGSHACVSHALLGDRVTLLTGARIGQEGFGFAVGPDGFETVPQLGRVVLEDGVEVGANSTIDRGSSQDTVIGAGSRLDNLVQIGHNTRLGRCCIVVSQAGISGSTELGDFVTVAAQAGLIGHIRIGAKARIGAQCGVMSDVEAGADVIGSPAMPFREFFRNVAVLRRLAKKASQNGGGEA